MASQSCPARLNNLRRTIPGRGPGGEAQPKADLANARAEPTHRLCLLRGTTRGIPPPLRPSIAVIRFECRASAVRVRVRRGSPRSLPGGRGPGESHRAAGAGRRAPRSSPKQGGSQSRRSRDSMLRHPRTAAAAAAAAAALPFVPTKTSKLVCRSWQAKTRECKCRTQAAGWPLSEQFSGDLALHSGERQGYLGEKLSERITRFPHSRLPLSQIAAVAISTLSITNQTIASINCSGMPVRTNIIAK